MPSRQPGPQDMWVSSLKQRIQMMICSPLQNKRIANSFSNALTVCPNPLTICLNFLMISSNTHTDCSYDLTVGTSNVCPLLERGLWRSLVMNSTEVLSALGQIDRNSQQVVPFLWEWLLAHQLKTIFFMSNMHLDCGLDSRLVWWKFKLIENEWHLFLELLVNSFMQICVERDAPNKSSAVF